VGDGFWVGILVGITVGMFDVIGIIVGSGVGALYIIVGWVGVRVGEGVELKKGLNRGVLPTKTFLLM